jgi:hypothetical protein
LAGARRRPLSRRPGLTRRLAGLAKGSGAGAATGTSSASTLNAELDIEPGADRDEFDRALDGQVLETAELVGGYER